MKQSFARVTKLSEVEEGQPTYLAIGVFDGVHLGHQKLLQSMVAAAQAEGARSAVLTFFPHPVTVIRGRQGRIYLGSLDERIELLAGQGLDLVISHPFDEEVRRTPATNFIDQLCRHLDLSQLWGGSFGLGFNREGDLPFLTQLGQEKGFSVHPFEAPVKWGGANVSSSRVRRVVEEGQVDEATGCLGRPYRLAGTVIHGDGRGRALGVPTANLSVWDELVLPASGVYATYAWLQGQRYLGATNVGYRPTVNGHNLNVETHLLDFDADIYGREVVLDFVARIRDEKKFDSLDELVNQIKADIRQVRQLLQPT